MEQEESKKKIYTYIHATNDEHVRGNSNHGGIEGRVEPHT